LAFVWRLKIAVYEVQSAKMIRRRIPQPDRLPGIFQLGDL
jgi:hypothetical protein